MSWITFLSKPFDSHSDFAPSCRNIMSNNTAFGTAQPPKRPAAASAPSTDAAEEASSAPVDPEWEAARHALLASYSKMLTSEDCIALPLSDVSHGMVGCRHQESCKGCSNRVQK